MSTLFRTFFVSGVFTLASAYSHAVPIEISMTGTITDLSNYGAAPIAPSGSLVGNTINANIIFNTDDIVVETGTESDGSPYTRKWLSNFTTSVQFAGFSYSMDSYIPVADAAENLAGITAYSSPGLKEDMQLIRSELIDADTADMFFLAFGILDPLAAGFYDLNHGQTTYAPGTTLGYFSLGTTGYSYGPDQVLRFSGAEDSSTVIFQVDQVAISAVPLPAPGLLLASALAMLGCLRRKSCINPA